MNRWFGKRFRTVLIAVVIASFGTIEHMCGQSLGKRIADWVISTPYEDAGPLPMTHTKLLFAAGQVGTLDTYLSEITHSGLFLQASSMVDYPEIHAGLWHIITESDLNFGITENPANAAKMYLIGARLSMATAYRAIGWNGFTLNVAPMVSASVQGNVKTSNTNNIGNVVSGLGMDAWARLRYTIPVETMPIALQYSVRIPLVGLVFQPEYGQSYYEFVSGENNAPIKLYLSSPYNYKSITQRFVVDLPVRNLTVSLGAEHSYIDQHINHLQFKQGQWTLLLGVTLDAFFLSGNRSARSNHIIRSID